MESCPSRSKEHDWKSCKRPKPFRGFESLALRQKQNHPLGWFCFLVRIKKQGIRTRREQTKFAEENSPVDCFRRRGNERSEAREHGSARKNPLLSAKNNESTFGRFVVFCDDTLGGIRTRREQTKFAEENSPVDCFRRRGNERSEAREHGSARKNPLLSAKE